MAEWDRPVEYSPRDHEGMDSINASPTIEELGQSYGEITAKIEEMLERRETIRQQLEMKVMQAKDMHDAISARFTERTGIHNPGAVKIMPKGML